MNQTPDETSSNAPVAGEPESGVSRTSQALRAAESDFQPQAFIFVTCQNGAESATKLELMTNHPNLKLSYSRPGFITFKVEPGSLPLHFHLKSTLARAYGWSLGRFQGDVADTLVRQLCSETRMPLADRIHVYERDPLLPGKNGFEPGDSALANEVASMIAQSLPIERAQPMPADADPSTDDPPLLKRQGVNQIARADQLVFDIVLVEPGQWWYGFHFANSTPGRWVGGIPPLNTRQEVYSRAYFKLREALLWSGIHVRPGDVCAELGSAPGGACSLLLEMGANVLAIDPAEMETSVLEHVNLTHLRRRVNEVKKRDFKPVRWLISDMNTDPAFALDTVETILGYEQVNVKGVIMTLKLTDWNLVKQIPQMIERLKGLGFQIVKARQLAFNRREYCLVGIKNKFVLRDSRRR